jgi:hypothetical protein
VKNLNYGPLYEEIFEKGSRTFSYSRERCSGFNLKTHAPTLLEEWRMT